MKLNNDIIQNGENYYTSIRLDGKQIQSKCLQMFLDKHICIFKPTGYICVIIVVNKLKTKLKFSANL